MLCFGAVSFVGASLTASGAHATTLMRMNLDQLARSAKEIVRARSLANRTGWDQGEIWTFTAFEVEETWRGEASGQISVKLLGGRTERITSFVSGVPRFRPGEEVILFLEPANDNYFSGGGLGTRHFSSKQGSGIG